MIEVETKVRISEPAFFRNRIKNIGKFIGKEKKIDDYYTLQNSATYPRKSLRIRKIGKIKIYEINFKKRISYISGVHAKNELEFGTSDIKNFIDLIKDFGFKKWLRKEKISEIYEIAKNFHIEINNVKNLGWFLEIECLSGRKDISFARKRVLDVIDKLNIKKKNIVSDGYTKMLWDLKKFS